MNNNSSLFMLAKHLLLAVEPLKFAFADVESFRKLMLQLGWAVDSLPQSYLNLAAEVEAAIADLDSLSQSPTQADALSLLASARGIYSAIQALSDVPEGVESAEFLEEFGQRLFEFLLLEYMAERFSTAYVGLEMLGVIEQQSFATTASRPGYIRSQLHWEEIPRIISDPLSIPQRVYGWGTPTLNFALLADHLFELFDSLHLLASIVEVSPELRTGFQPLPPAETEKAIDKLVKVALFETEIDDEIVYPEIAVLELPAEGTHLPGVIIQPVLPQGLSETVNFDYQWQLNLRAGTDLSTVFGIVIRPGDRAIRYPFQPDTAFPPAGFGASIDFSPDQPSLLLGASDATRLELQGATFGIDVNAREDDLEISLAIALKGFAIVLSPGEADSFVCQALGDSEQRLDFPLTLVWSSTQGLHFQGSSGFELQLYPQRNLGPISIPEAQFGLFATEAPNPGIILETGLAIKGRLGPVQFNLNRVGLKLETTFIDGNAGPFNIDLGFMPPEGVGLAINSGPVTGGGFLDFDPDKAQYSGIVQLQFEQLSLTAIGLLTTRMPDSTSGFSLLIMLTVDDFQPIELGLGFKLTGLGGLLGFNRTVDINVLRDGLKNQTLDRVLFPADPIQNAAAIVSTLRTVFPPTADQYVLGPIAQISWGKEGLLTADLGLMLEFPHPVRLVVLGQMRVLFPSKAAPLVRLNLDLLGVIDFDKSEALVLATLFDSRFYDWTITGDAAFFLRWQHNPLFILSVGGFHPAFMAPPELPQLTRLTMLLSRGKNVQLRMTWYLALTSNTLQHGARVDLRVTASKFRIDGHLSYDALVQFDPFGFVVLFSAGVGLKWGSRTLASVQLEGELSGPSPWHLQGKARFKIWRFSKSVSFDHTIGSAQTLPPLPVVDPKPALLAALGDPGNWQASLPAAGEMLVTFQERPLPGIVLVHPLGDIAVRQQVLPLKEPIEKFGNSRTATTSEYAITQVRFERQVLAQVDLLEPFAPGEYQDLSQSDKLSRPSFVSMAAGVRVSVSAGLSYGEDHLRSTNLTYEEDLFLANGSGNGAPVHRTDIELSAADLQEQARQGAAVQAAQVGLNRFARSPQAPQVQIQGTEYVVATRVDLTVSEEVQVVDDGSGVPNPQADGRSYLRALQALKEYEQSHPAQKNQLQVIPKFEAREQELASR